jgi:HAMP domain-containing protein
MSRVAASGKCCGGRSGGDTYTMWLAYLAAMSAAFLYVATRRPERRLRV